MTLAHNPIEERDQARPLLLYRVCGLRWQPESQNGFDGLPTGFRELVHIGRQAQQGIPKTV